MLKKLLIQMEDYFLPSRCCICQKIGPSICPACRVRIRRVNNFCSQCGKKSKLGLICKKCKQKKNSYDAYFFLSSNENYVIKKSLSAFKHKRNKEVGLILGKLLGRQFLYYWPKKPNEWQALESVIVPLPIGKKTENKISFNPAEIIALGLSQVTGIKMLNRQLRIKKSFFKKETQFSWRGKNLEKTLVIVVSESMSKLKTLEDVSSVLKSSGAKITIFISITNSMAD